MSVPGSGIGVPDEFRTFPFRHLGNLEIERAFINVQIVDRVAAELVLRWTTLNLLHLSNRHVLVLFGRLRVNLAKHFEQCFCVKQVLLNDGAELGLHVFERGDDALGGMLEVVDDHVDKHFVQTHALFKRVILLFQNINLLLELCSFIFQLLEQFQILTC